MFQFHLGDNVAAKRPLIHQLKNDTMAAPSYSKKNNVLLGNAMHSVALTLTLLYAVGVATIAQDPNQQIFDREWTKHGFCISNSSLPFQTSHDMAFYVDIIFTIIMLTLAFLWRKEGGTVVTSLLGFAFATVGHGVAHEWIAHTIRTDTYQQEVETLSPVASVALTVGFWFPFLNSTCTRVPWPLAAIAAFVAQQGMTNLPLMYGFTYVQTVITVAATTNHLTNPLEEKEKPQYAMGPMIVSIPVAILAWIECLWCNTFYKQVGGHVWFDITLGSCTIVFLCFVHGWERNGDLDAREKNTEAKTKSI